MKNTNRPKDKIEKYLATLMKQFNGSCIEGTKSRYYSFNERVIRISDHIGRNSSGHVSIIIDDSLGKTKYILHSHISGKLITLTSYEHVKEFVRSFVYMSAICDDMQKTNFEFAMDSFSEEIAKNKTQFQSKVDTLQKEKQMLENQLNDAHKKIVELTSKNAVSVYDASKQNLGLVQGDYKISERNGIFGIPVEFFESKHVANMIQMCNNVRKKISKEGMPLFTKTPEFYKTISTLHEDFASAIAVRMKPDCILGVPIDWFSQSQLESIKRTCEKVNSKHK